MFNSRRILSIVFYIFIIGFISLAYIKNNEGLTMFFLKKTVKSSKKIINLGYGEKEYKVDYTKKFVKSSIELAGFEADEKWIGLHTINTENYWEGGASYMLSSKNSQPNIISLEKNVNLSGYTIIKLLVYSDKDIGTENVKKFNLRLGNDDDSAYYEFDIRNIKPGWNLIQISKDKFTFASNFNSLNNTYDNQIYTGHLLLWDKIEKISVELDSLPKSQAEVSIDRLWAEKNEDYKLDFKNTAKSSLSVKTYNDNTYINVWGLDGKLSLVEEVAHVSDFVYTAKIIPQKNGAFGINARTDADTGRGYYLEMGGIGLGTWQFYKKGEVVDNNDIAQLGEGVLSNSLLEINKPVWLRIRTSGNTIAGYSSFDGVNFTKLSEKKDDEIKTGGIGIHTTAASFLLESIEFNQ